MRENAQLSQAALRTAALAFQDALAASGYRATRSLLIRITGDTGTRSIVSFVAGNYCAHLTEPAYTEVGIYQRVRETRIVLAAPFSPPALEASDAVAVRVLQLVNQARSRPRICGSSRFSAAGPVRLNDLLRRISLAHATDMAQHNYFSHEGRDGSAPTDRLTRAGYDWRSAGENIAAGPTSAEAVVEGWMNSPPHCANLMTPSHTEMGVAYSVNKASGPGIYWVLILGARR